MMTPQSSLPQKAIISFPWDTTDGPQLVCCGFLSWRSLHDWYMESSEDHQYIGRCLKIKSMVFTGNGLRFLDIGVKEFNVWEPSALVRREDADDSTDEGHTSFNTASSQLAQAYTGNVCKLRHF
jgi:hypothetical protein